MALAFAIFGFVAITSALFAYGVLRVGALSDRWLDDDK